MTSDISFFDEPIYPTDGHIEGSEISPTVDRLDWTGVLLPSVYDARPEISPGSTCQQPNPDLQRNLENTDQTKAPQSYKWPPIPHALADQSSVLVEYYFKNVANLFSCYDGKMNPFRSNVSQLWGSTASIFYTVQSMAAACLIDVVPSLSEKGIELRRKAAAAMELELSVPQPHAGALLALIMLGLTASWHNSHDLGRAELERAHIAFNAMKIERTRTLKTSVGEDRNIEFFHKALLYWEMLLSYVVDDQTEGLDTNEAVSKVSLIEAEPPRARLPHPWTGVACEAQRLVFKVGRLLRQLRRCSRRGSATSDIANESRKQQLREAVDLMNRLHDLRFPNVDTIVDPSDTETPVDHFLKIADCYRDVGLLQLCRGFPELLQSSDVSELSEKSKELNSNNLQSWLATNVISLLKSIPTTSGTRCVQPFLFVALSSELQIPISSKSIASDYSSTAVCSADDIPGMSPGPIDIFEARKFVMSRMSLFQHTLPAKPIRQMLQVMEETWKRMDEGNSPVNWLDIMIQHGWETIMG